ncbi:hypothetical protein ACFXPR_36220 [Nocardia tengchongensis]|uniref:hypothetical protein n=1 Tax=Nocardia tengchongensis TaxID=2055889 RepID=UPI003692D795
MSALATDTAVEALAREILAVPDFAALFADPAALIVQMAAHITELRRRLGGATHDREVAERWIERYRPRFLNMRADHERLQDAAMCFAVELGLADPTTTAQG